MKELPVRKNIRLKEYDCSNAGYYFVTVCVKDKHEMLGKVVNSHMILNDYGNVVKREIENMSIIKKGMYCR